LYSLSLPAQRADLHGGPLWTPHVSGVLLAILSYHGVALAGSWAATLIRIDGVRLPRSVIAVATGLVVFPMLVFPTLMIIPWQAIRPPEWDPEGLYVDAVMRIVSGLVAAAFFARVLAKGLCPGADLKLNPLGGGTARLIDLVAMLSIPGVLIGWQSMPAVVILAALATYLLRPLLNTLPINDGPRGHIDRRGAMEAFSFAIPVVLTFHLVGWRVLWNTPFWPSDRSGTTVIIVWGLAALVVPVFLVDRSDTPFDSRPVAEQEDEEEFDDQG